MSEYQAPLNLKDGVLDTRGMPLDSRRNPPIPDAMHQLKSTLNSYRDNTLKMIAASEQEAINLKNIASYRAYGFTQEAKEGHFEVTLQFDASAAKCCGASCGN
ncbi:MAG: hypothetical protein IBX43_06160 [Campylobacterales bacterium]|nr:hypothetical protein [Campylobacterales bacterium]